MTQTIKGRTVFIWIALIVLADQALKIYIKTHFRMNEAVFVAGEWFRLHFVENEGMAYGLSFGGDWGKILLTSFRLAAVLFGVWYIRHIIQKGYNRGFIICAALIFSGALGNLIDSLFYGMIFTASDFTTVATMFPKEGYAGFMHGHVVDMFYFPIIRDAHFPSWVPIWGGEPFEFFRPIFNLADAAISVGVITLLIFQQRFLQPPAEAKTGNTVQTRAAHTDESEIQ